MKVLVTGAAGFIGGHVSSYLTSLGHEVIGFDNFSPYYSPSMKRAHLSNIPRFQLEEVDISDQELVFQRLREISPDHVIHLAAQGGVRASRTSPLPYLATNQIGFLNILQASENVGVEKFIYASSSSVYGEGLVAPFKEDSVLPAPKSLYALSKLSNENIARNLPFRNTQRIGLRFFTVYGPWGRPDMAVFRLLASSLLGKDFVLTADLEVKRDFTYVSDVATTINSLLETTKPLQSEIFNVAGSHPYTLSQLFTLLENHKMLPKIVRSSADLMDVKLTHGSIAKLNDFSLSIPDTTLDQGILETWQWIQSVSSNDLRDWFEYSK
jgi:UDP-glucuronate 4-epimerase